MFDAFEDLCQPQLQLPGKPMHLLQVERATDGELESAERRVGGSRGQWSLQRARFVRIEQTGLLALAQQRTIHMDEGCAPSAGLVMDRPRHGLLS